MDNIDLLNYRVIGEGYPVVLLHGFLESIDMWKYLSFEKEFLCVLIDLPGHGDSLNFSNSMISMKAMAIEVRKVMDELNITEYSVIGHSMGGYVGLELKHMDKRCQKLVLLNSNFWQDSELKKEDRGRVAEIVKQNKNLFLYEAIPNLFNHPEKYNEDIKSIIATAKKMQASAIGAISKAMANRSSFIDALPSLKNNILVIQGEFDEIVPLQKMKDALSDFPELAVHIVECGHMAHIEKTELTQGLIGAFLK